MPFTRETVRQPFAVRRLTVARTRRVTPTIVRVTFVGADVAGFRSPSPNDHVKLFFPDPGTGVIVAPEITPEGPRLPAGAPPVSRDYTPRAWRPGTAGGPAELDIDFVVHGDGPASSWAASAAAGGELVVAGPRGSHLVPEGIDGALLLADETGLPALARWVEMLPADVRIAVLLHLADVSAADALTTEHRDRITALAITDRADGPGALLTAVQEQEPIGPRTFVFGAGEATSLLPVRARLRKELGLPREQVALNGYWKVGVVGLDHHAPLDPSDPD